MSSPSPCPQFSTPSIRRSLSSVIVPSKASAPCSPQFSTLFIRAVRVRRFETLSRQDFFQFVTVGLVCGMIW